MDSKYDELFKLARSFALTGAVPRTKTQKYKSEASHNSSIKYYENAYDQTTK